MYTSIHLGIRQEKAMLIANKEKETQNSNCIFMQSRARTKRSGGGGRLSNLTPVSLGEEQQH
jgi:hypothetical protein